jgi:hypothetical protein
LKLDNRNEIGVDNKKIKNKKRTHEELKLKPKSKRYLSLH